MKKTFIFLCMCLVTLVFAEGSKEQAVLPNEAGIPDKLEEPYDFTLSVYGNANADDTIDEDDIVYVRGILDGVNKSTRFADANYDGRIDDKDISQIKAIIEAQPVSITLIDNRGVTVTVNVPVNKLAVLFYGPMRPVLYLQGSDNIAGIGSRMLSMGFILDREEMSRAEELISYCNSQIHEIQELTAAISEKDKVKVLLLSNKASEEVFNVGTCYEPIDIAGGNNVAMELDSISNWAGGLEVSPEQVILWNPDIILFHSYSKDNSFLTTETLLTNKHLQTVSSVKDKRIYGTKARSAGWDPATALCECFYMAKLFYPDLFKEHLAFAKKLANRKAINGNVSAH